MSDSIKYEVGHKVRLKPEITDARLIEIGVNDKAFRGRLLKGEAAEVILERQQDKDPPHEHGCILRLSYKCLDSCWEVYADMVIPVTPYFRKGDKVRVHATVEQLESINIEEDYADELVAGLTGEFNQHTPNDPKFPYGAFFKHEDGSHGHLGFEPGMLQPVKFRPGDRVRCVATADDLERMGISYGPDHKEILESVGVVVASDNAPALVKYPRTEWWITASKLILAIEDEADVEAVEDESEWDPMTEPIHLGDLVEVVYDNEYKGMQGRVTKCEDPKNGPWRVEQDNGESAGDNWSRRSSLKLLEKGDGSSQSSKPKKKDEPPPPKVAVGDKVRITHTTRELQAIGYDVIGAARRAGKTGVVQQVDSSAPHVMVHVESIDDTAWCNFDGVEKVAA